jgi:hypothetical protein
LVDVDPAKIKIWRDYEIVPKDYFVYLLPFTRNVMMLFSNNLFRLLGLLIVALMLIPEAQAQGSVTRSGSTWSGRVNGTTVYSGSRFFDAVNATCNNMGAGTIDIWNSGESGNDGGNVYAIRPNSNQTLDFHDHQIICNSNGALAVGIYADRKSNITVRNVIVTGNPRYGFWFRGCNDVTFTDITMDLSNNNPVGLGIRVDGSTASASDLTINGNILIEGSAAHAIETYSVDGVNIGNVTCNNTGGCGVLLNDSENCTVGVVTGNYNNQNGGYATFRVANNNRSTSCAGVYSRNSGRGFFSVSGSQDCTVAWVDIANTNSQGIFLEDATNTHVLSGSVSNGNPNCQEVRTSNCSINVSGCGGGGGSTVYQLRNRGTGLYLDGMGRTTNGDACGQWANTTHPNSQWEFISVGSGYTQLRNVGTGLFLDGMGRTTNGDDLGQWANTTSYNSHWSVQPYDGIYHRIRNRGTNLYIDGMGRTTNGDAGGQWANTTHPNSQWELVSVSGSRLGRDVATAESQPSAACVLYPNPAMDVLAIQFAAEAESAEVRIYNLAGQLMASEQAQGAGHKMNIRQLTPGVYLVEVRGATGTERAKLVKN